MSQELSKKEVPQPMTAKTTELEQELAELSIENEQLRNRGLLAKLMISEERTYSDNVEDSAGAT